MATICPRCREEVHPDSTGCRHCGVDFDRVTRRGRRRIHPGVWVAVALLLAWAMLSSYQSAGSDADDMVDCIRRGGTYETCR